jgi:hypothetical protein
MLPVAKNIRFWSRIHLWPKFLCSLFPDHLPGAPRIPEKKFFWFFSEKWLTWISWISYNKNRSGTGVKQMKRRRQKRGNKERSVIDLTPEEWDLVDYFIEEFTVARRKGMTQNEFFSLLLKVGKEPLEKLLEEEKRD